MTYEVYMVEIYFSRNGFTCKMVSTEAKENPKSAEQWEKMIIKNYKIGKTEKIKFLKKNVVKRIGL
jgi:hypothetical protein